jgi:hypothetical protein
MGSFPDDTRAWLVRGTFWLVRLHLVGAVESRLQPHWKVNVNSAAKAWTPTRAPIPLQVTLKLAVLG